MHESDQKPRKTLSPLTQIDYTLHTDRERVQLVAQLLSDKETLNHLESTFTLNTTQAQLEGLANYILYGKNLDNTPTPLETKHIHIEAKHTTYRRKQDLSLNALLENPSFDQRSLHHWSTRNVYTKPKQTITRPTYDELGNEVDPGDSHVPGMTYLWHSIDAMGRQLALALGKEQPLPHETPPNWNPYQLYKIRHWLIALRKHQYALKESYLPLIPSRPHFPERTYIDWGSNSGYWRSLGPDEDPIGDLRYNPTTGQLETYHLVRAHTLNFADPLHVYHLLIHYDALWKESCEDVEGPMKFILHDFDAIGRRTHFTEVQEIVLDCKVAHWTNERTAAHLYTKTGLSYNHHYISTLFKQTICGKLAATATLMAKESAARRDPTQWKKCSVCGQRLLLDAANFVRKASARDGYAARCKLCDRARRETQGDPLYG